MKIALVAAMSENGVIGNAQKLPWHLPEELKYFRELTLGKPVIMGRQTFESIGSRPLPRRRNIILTRQKDLMATGCEIAHSVTEAITLAGSSEELMVVGGAEIYEAFLSEAHRIYLTIVHAHYEGDTFFPAVSWNEWELRSEKKWTGFSTQVWDKK
jgi:dihydrofolate reductase